MSSVNELCQRLNILLPLEQSTCIGHGLRKPTCGCSVSLSSRKAANRVLEDVSYDITAGHQVQVDELQLIAGLLLCKRNHQSQGQELARRWQHTLQERTSQSPPRQLNEIVGTSRNISTMPPSLIGADLRQPSNAALIAELKRRLSIDTNLIANLLGEIAPLPGRVIGSNLDPGPSYALAPVPFSQAPPSEQRGGVITNISASTSTQPCPQHSRNILPMPTSRRRAEQSSEMTQQFLNENSIAIDDSNSMSNHPTGLVNDSLPLERPSTPRAPLRHSHVECAICYETYDGDNEAEYWECHTCQNRTHYGCFRKWSEAAGSQSVRCVYCRTTV